MTDTVRRLLAVAGISGALVGMVDYSLPGSRNVVLRAFCVTIAVLLIPVYVRLTRIPPPPEEHDSPAPPER